VKETGRLQMTDILNATRGEIVEYENLIAARQ
jgi:hypothetical protein